MVGALAHTCEVDEASGEVHSLLWRDGTLEAQDFPFEEISNHLEEEGVLVWVDLCDPSPEQLQALADELSLDPLAVEDSIGKAERAKATRYANHTFITVYAVDAEPEGSAADTDPHSRLRTTRISAFVLHRGVITVRQGAGFDTDAVVRRWEDSSDLLKYGVGALVHGLLDVIVDGHFEAVQVLDDAIESIEDGLFDDRVPNSGIQRHTYQIRKDLVELRRVVLPMREVVNAVLRHRQDIDAPHELDGWYDDLYDHVLRATRMDGVVARDGLHDLRDQPVAAGRPPEHGDEEADVVGGDHRGADCGDGLLRPERPIPGVQPAVGLLAERQHHRRAGADAVRVLQEAWLALIEPARPSKPYG